MKILFVDSEFAVFDRNSAGLRMFTIAKLLAAQGHSCEYCAIAIPTQRREFGSEAVNKYRLALEALGIRTHIGGLEKVLQSRSFDIVFIEYFYVAEACIQTIRIWQPKARVVVDSVDIHHVRLQAKAEMTRQAEDYIHAEEIKQRELALYKLADLLITLTEEDTKALKRELPQLPTHIIPNIHEIPSTRHQEGPIPELIFVGAFPYDPNVDAVFYFYREIWPLIHDAIPDASWTIVGDKPTDEIRALASDHITITGYVPETMSYLLRSWVSIAPLRFGAGMKGKVGEAMAAGVPVVTTSFGAQGLGAEPGEHLLVAATPQEFAAHVIELLKDKEKREQIGRQGRALIQQQFSVEAINKNLIQLLSELKRLSPPSTVPFHRSRRFLRKMSIMANRYVLWRIRA